MEHRMQETTTRTDWSIADPGDAGTIDATVSGVCGMTTAGAETRKLLPPHHLGQWLVLAVTTYVGAATVTSYEADGTTTEALNNTGDTVMTFGSNGEAIQLVAIYLGSDLRWRLVGPWSQTSDTEGPTLS